MATEVSDPAAEALRVREEWIAARVQEFGADSAVRDRAIASILFDSLTLRESVGQMVAMVQKEGLGGIAKAMLMGGKNGR